MGKIANFLKKCGLRKAINAFLDHKIKMQHTTSLSERELEVLFPIIGERQKFKTAMKLKRAEDIIRKRKREADGWIIEKLTTIKKNRMRSNGTKKQAKGITKKTSYSSTSHSRNVVRHIIQTDEAATSALVDIVDEILTSHSVSLKVDAWRDFCPEKKLIDFEKGKLNCPVCCSQITPYLRKVSPIKWKADNYRRHLEKFHADLKDSCEEEEHDFASMLVDVVIGAADSSDYDDWSDSDSVPLASCLLKKSKNEKLPIADTSLPNRRLLSGMLLLQSGQAISIDSQPNDAVPNDSLQAIQQSNGMYEQHSSSTHSFAVDQQLELADDLQLLESCEHTLPNHSVPLMKSLNTMQDSSSTHSFAVDQQLESGDDLQLLESGEHTSPNHSVHLMKSPNTMQDSSSTHSFTVDQQLELTDDLQLLESGEHTSPNHSVPLMKSPNTMQDSSSTHSFAVDQQLELTDDLQLLESGEHTSPNHSVPLMKSPNTMQDSSSTHSFAVDQQLKSGDDQQLLESGEHTSPNHSVHLMKSPNTMQDSSSTHSFAVDQQLELTDDLQLLESGESPNHSVPSMKSPNTMQDSSSTHAFAVDQQLELTDDLQLLESGEHTSPNHSVPLMKSPNTMQDSSSTHSFAVDQQLESGELTSANSQPNHFVPVMDSPNAMQHLSLADDQQLLESVEHTSINFQPSHSVPVMESPSPIYEQHSLPSVANQPLRPSEPISDVLELPLNEYTDDGHRCYSKLMRGDLPVHLGDTVYILRDIQLSGTLQSVFTSTPGKHTYKTIGEIDYTECDIFRVEQMWKDRNDNRYVFGHHYLRPCETFHKAAKKFFHNELVKASIYEKLSIDLIMGRCWVLDPKSFCKGRPIDSEEVHVYICELKVDKARRMFSKISKRQEYPVCSKPFAFKTFDHELKITRNYSPYHVNNANKKG